MDMFCMWVRAQQCKVPHMQKQKMQAAEPTACKSPITQRKNRARAKPPKQKWSKCGYPRLFAILFICLFANQLHSPIPRWQTTECPEGSGNWDWNRLSWSTWELCPPGKQILRLAFFPGRKSTQFPGQLSCSKVLPKNKLRDGVNTIERDWSWVATRLEWPKT